MPDCPECMESLGDNKYRCTKHGFIIIAKKLPIKCSLCSPPSLLQKTKNFSKAIINHACDGFTRVSEEEFKVRLDICNECEQRDGMVCKICGCFLNVKASWKSEKCPLHKWPDENKEEQA